jgi:hypothetical protein
MQSFVLILTLVLPCFSWGIEDAREVSSNDVIAKSSVQLLFRYKSKWEACTGTLVSKTRILTAAHCVDWYFTKSKEAVAIFGTKKYLTPNDAPAEIKRIIKSQAILHPKYKHSDDADQALLKFAGLVPAGFNEIKVKHAYALRKLDLSQLIVHTHGFGPAKCHGRKRDTKKLRKRALIDLSVLRDEKKKNWMTLGATASLCQGDSGGAIVTEIDNKTFLIGINVSGDETFSEFVTIDPDFLKD